MNHKYKYSFLRPAVRDKFTITGHLPDSSGFTQSRRFTQDDISQEQTETFNEVVARIAVLSDEWKALQVWARLDQAISSPLEEGEVSPNPGMQSF